MQSSELEAIVQIKSNDDSERSCSIGTFLSRETHGSVMAWTKAIDEQRTTMRRFTWKSREQNAAVRVEETIQLEQYISVVICFWSELLLTSST